MSLNKYLILTLVVAACGRPVKEVPGPATLVQGPVVEVPVLVLPEAESPIQCEVFEGQASLPTTYQTKGSLSIGLEAMTLAAQANDLLPFDAFLGTEASAVTNNFALRCNMKFEVKTAGSHKFFLGSDDGSELYVDGVRLINNGGSHGLLEKTGSVTLPLGIHDLQVRYFEGGGPKELYLKVQEPTVVPTPHSL